MFNVELKKKKRKIDLLVTRHLLSKNYVGLKILYTMIKRIIADEKLIMVIMLLVTGKGVLKLVTLEK